MESNRREFLRNFLHHAAKQALTEFDAGVGQSVEADYFSEFFDSYESSYALTLNYPDDILLETARQEGIEVKDREKIDIVREMFRKKRE
ncbi:MAG: hypothetical protein V1792_25295 [Pseudomonadota bacterium]